uniref:HAT C-terminal dimerisation domain-containing protein n=1 Tax=Rhipicephalus pulchellus TaxID=72859 RepID=L7LYE3_RHIPC
MLTPRCAHSLLLLQTNSFSPAQRHLQAMDLVKKYPFDLANTFPDELEQFISYASNEGCSSVADMLKLLIREKLEGSFPDVHMAITISLCLMVTNCTVERSFSKLKLIKKRLRSTMTDSRLSDLSLLSVEAEVLRRVKIEELINKLSQQKARKRL